MIDPIEFLNNYRFEDAVLRDVAKREKKRRKSMKITQKDMAERTGVSLGSIKRFEQTGEISFHSLLKIAFVLDCLDDFDQLFAQKYYRSAEKVLRERRR
ncbi:helix-turn-helix transcriptional regulator [Erysipelotrichaceae bacterium 66-17]